MDAAAMLANPGKEKIHTNTHLHFNIVLTEVENVLHGQNDEVLCLIQTCNKRSIGPALVDGELHFYLIPTI